MPPQCCKKIGAPQRGVFSLRHRSRPRACGPCPNIGCTPTTGKSEQETSNSRSGVEFGPPVPAQSSGAAHIFATSVGPIAL